MGTTTTVEVLPQNQTYVTLTGMRLTATTGPSPGSSVPFDLITGTYPITWTSQGNLVSRGTTGPIPARTLAYPGLSMNVFISLNATLDTSGNVTYDAENASLSFQVTSTSGMTTNGQNVTWLSPYFSGYSSNFRVRLEDGTILQIGRATEPRPGTKTGGSYIPPPEGLLPGPPDNSALK